MALTKEMQTYIKKIEKGHSDIAGLLRQGAGITTAVVLFTVVSLILDLSIKAYVSLTGVYIFVLMWIFLYGSDDHIKDVKNKKLAKLTFWPTRLWIVFFGYFNLFFIGFGPRISFGTVVISLLIFLGMILIYTVATVLALEKLYEDYTNSIPVIRLVVGAIISISEAILFGYITLLVFHWSEALLKLTPEKFLDKYGALAKFYQMLNFF